MKYPCQLVNPYCPEDLCILPITHKGFHHLGTMSEPTPLPHMRRAIKGGPYTEDQLSNLGWELADKLGLHDRKNNAT